MQRSKNFAPLHPSFYAVLCLRRTGLAPMNGKSSLQGGQAERLSDFVGLGAAGNRRIPGGSPDPLYGGIHETKKRKADHPSTDTGAV